VPLPTAAEEGAAKADVTKARATAEADVYDPEPLPDGVVEPDPNPLHGAQKIRDVLATEFMGVARATPRYYNLACILDMVAQVEEEIKTTLRKRCADMLGNTERAAELNVKLARHNAELRQNLAAFNGRV
jgi:hypothetical protein